MLTGAVQTVPIASITVAPNRQRKDFRNIEDLANSINATGLINPIVLTPDNVLVAGERRLRACIELGHTHIAAQYTTDLTIEDAELIELEENVKREDLTWREMVDSVSRLYALKAASDPEWTLRKAGAYLSMSPATIANYLLVSRYIDEGDELVTNAAQLSVAINAARRREERAKDDDAALGDEAIDDFFSEGVSIGEVPAPRGIVTPATPADAEAFPSASTPSPAGASVGAAAVCPILNLDFAEWAATPLAGRRINFLHCDFPYGINFQRHGGGAGRSMGHYDDSPEAFDICMDALRASMAGHIAESAHIMFWFSSRLDLLFPTFEALGEMGWKMNPVPLIWHRNDNSGILPDPARGPRQVYEVALFGSRGDRKVAQAVSNFFAFPKTKEVHPSEKPRPMLDHFFRMFVDNTTVMLDPTCGSGNSVIAAAARGARSVLGLEAHPDHHSNAVAHWHRCQEEEGDED